MTHQVRTENQERSHASNCSCHTAGLGSSAAWSQSFHTKSQPGMEDTVPKSLTGQHEHPPSHCFRQSHPSSSGSSVCPHQLLRHSRIFPGNFRSLLGGWESIPCLIRRDAAAWLWNGKEGAAPQADSWDSLKYVGRYLSLRLQGLSQKIPTHLKRSLTDRSKRVWHGTDTSLKLGNPLLCLNWVFLYSFSSTFLL